MSGGEYGGASEDRFSRLVFLRNSIESGHGKSLALFVPDRVMICRKSMTGVGSLLGDLYRTSFEPRTIRQGRVDVYTKLIVKQGPRIIEICFQSKVAIQEPST